MRRKVAVIEDDPDIRADLSELLVDEGYDVVAYSNGEDALRALREMADLPHVILLDLMMPVMNGYQFREAQRKEPGFGHVPVVVLSADGQAGKHPIAQTVSAFLKKPIDVEALLSAIAKHSGG